MEANKLNLIKQLIEKKIADLDVENFIKPYERQLVKILNTPADEYSISGNLETGIKNLLEAARNIEYIIGYQYSKQHTYAEILKLFELGEDQLNTKLNPPKAIEKTWSILDGKDLSEAKSTRKHFGACTLIDEDWGSDNCICPGAYIYRKYLSIGLSKEEAQLIVKYFELGDTMKEDYDKAKELYEKQRFLKIKAPDQKE